MAKKRSSFRFVVPRFLGGLSRESGTPHECSYYEPRTAQLAVCTALIALFAAAPHADSGEEAVDGVPATKFTAEQYEFFEQRVRPVLAASCQDCHSGDEPESGLAVDSLQGLLQGGMRGPAIVPGKPEASLLLMALNHGELVKMPPKEKLSPKVIADVAAWIKIGAPWPNSEATSENSAAPRAQGAVVTDEDRSFWAFLVPAEHTPPPVRNSDWVQTPIDNFILAKLEAAELQPAPEADKRTLIRRVTFDLTGLPPVPEDVEAFLADASPDAFEKVVDRLLDSPQYGERWGRHWLDVARFADSNGLDENLAYANAYRYRDYVINAFNSDKPFDEFVTEQLAGDLLTATDAAERYEHLTATGFLTLGAKMLAEDDPMKMQMDIVDEQVDTVGRALMGLTLGCARCHDHKFDPIPTADYYSLAGIFKSTRTMDTFTVVARWHEEPLAGEQLVRERDDLRQQVQTVRAEFDKLPKEQTAERDKLQERIKSLESSTPNLPEAMAVADGTPENLRVHIRGSHLTFGAEAPRRFPDVFSKAISVDLQTAGSGRLEFANWLTQAGHPLTARVMVNRIWLGHFGEGLVRTPDNFGRLGEQPTHPELLDWLARRFIESGWSMKSLHRLIVTSAVYRMSTRHDERAASVDPENRLYWRRERRRLEAEAIRDSLLAVAGSLDFSMGGTMLQTPNRQYITSTANVNPVVYDSSRRSVYLPVVRSALYDVFQAFDFADPSTLSGRRESTTVAPQALFMMNSKLAATQAHALANRVEQLASNDAARVELLYSLALSRTPTDEERQIALDYLASYNTVGNSADKESSAAWTSLARAVLSSNEFIYVE